jgi:hypothetical protein
MLSYQLFEKWRQKDHEFKARLGKVSETLSPKHNIRKRARDMAHMVEILSSMYESLGSILIERDRKSIERERERKD